jgi:hypothetical protein
MTPRQINDMKALRTYITAGLICIGLCWVAVKLADAPKKRVQGTIHKQNK